MSIIKNNVLYHNVEDIWETNEGDKLYRFPREVIKHMNPHARFMAEYVCGCELRFVTDAKRIHINLSIQGSQYAQAIILKGDYVHDVVTLQAGKSEMIEIVCRDMNDSTAKIFCKDNDFLPNVWRVHLHNCMCTVNYINTMGYDIRPPHKTEMPQKTMLAIGSSITHGARSITHTNSYANEAGRILGVNVLNKGLGGSCQYEPEVADFYASNDEWDFAWIEGAVNCGVLEVDEFEKRFTYFVDTLYKTGKPLYMTTILPTASLINDKEDNHEKMLEFNEIIRSQKDKGVIIEGTEIITDLRFLTTDLIHPSNEGHTRMGINLAGILKKYL